MTKNPPIIIIYDNIILKQFSQIDDLKLFTDLPDIIQFRNMKIKNEMPFLYLNRKKINIILYENEDFVNVKINKNNMNLKYYFFLSLLISENKDIVNYKYTFEFINNVNKYQKNIDKNKIYKKLMIAKIIIELINNYNTEDNKEELNIIKDENINIINNIINNIEHINKLIPNKRIKYIIEEKIDKIYIDIIIALLKETKFLNIEYIIDILNQLELESINITKSMVDVLSKKIINMDSDLIKEYIIKNIDDLFNSPIHIIYKTNLL